jgi:hypothetical protein
LPVIPEVASNCLRLPVVSGRPGENPARRRACRVEHHQTLWTAVEDVASAKLTDRDCGPREPLAAGDTLAPEPLGSGQAGRVDQW